MILPLQRKYGTPSKVQNDNQNYCCAKRETRSFLRHSLVDSTERGRHHCSGELEQLLLTCIEGCAVVYEVILIGSKFMLLQLAGMRTVLKIDLCTVQLGR